MELTELSLAPTKNYSTQSEGKKRKLLSDDFWVKSSNRTGETLQLSDHPLPLDLERFLDLESGEMHYQNRKKTSRKNLSYSKGHLNLELNMSTIPNSSSDQPQRIPVNSNTESNKPRYYEYSCVGSTNMIALACSNCHLLVIMSKSSPSCPNCKYFHSFQQNPQAHDSVESLNTLSLLN